MKNGKNIAGFTLVEVLFAITIGLMLIGAIYVAIQSGQRASMAIESKVAAQQDARAALEMMAAEITMASYNATFVSNIWRTAAIGGACGISASQGYKGIQIATAAQLGVEMDVNESGAVGDNANEVIIYTFYPATQRVTRSTNCGAEADFLGCLDADNNGRCDADNFLRNIRVVNLAFTYFNGQGVQILPAALPAGIPNIRRIDITLTVDTDAVDPNTGARRRMIYSTSVVPRNHPRV